MKFSKPINREVDINGTSYILSLSDTGVEFRVKGKRKATRVDWPQVLELAGGEQGASQRSTSGAEAAPQVNAQAQERMQQIFEPQTGRGAQTGEGDGDENEDRSRTATASERGTES
jgi:hypothetical protein